MGGFKRNSNNIEFEKNLFELIILHISQSCEKMYGDCNATSNMLYNHEDKISNRLVERYLKENKLGLKFIREMSENFNDKTDTYIGRTDIIVGSSDWLHNHRAYYVIECKRIDGSNGLNEKYVSEGVFRFVGFPEPKYSSHYGKNIMLGYIVKAIDIRENTKKIDTLQRKSLVDLTIGSMSFVSGGRQGLFRYQCLYQSEETLQSVALTHLFHDFSSVVRPK